MTPPCPVCNTEAVILKSADSGTFIMIGCQHAFLGPTDACSLRPVIGPLKGEYATEEFAREYWIKWVERRKQDDARAGE